MYPCHSQMTAMAAMAFFAEALEWKWHYNPVLDSLYVMTTSCVRLHIFFRLFAVSVLSPFFDSEALFDRIPLYMAHPAAASPQPTSLASPDTDLLEANASTSFSSFASGGGMHPPCDPETVGILESGFLSSESV